MSGYIYQVKQGDIQLGQEEQTRIQTTRKYEATRFLERQLMEGLSLSGFEVTRSRDGRVDTLVHIDPYEFMNIDMGEL
jgi:hypothetical protein